MEKIITEQQAIQIVGDAEELRKLLVASNYQHGDLAILRTGAKLALSGYIFPRLVVHGDSRDGCDVSQILDALNAGRTRLLASQQVGNPIPECA